jgi:hypothetical protein
MIAGYIDHRKIIAADGTQADSIGRIAVADPMPAIAGMVPQAEIFSQKAAELFERQLAEALAIADGQLEGGALQMAEKNFEIVGMDVGIFGRRAKEIIGVLDDVLVKRRARGESHTSNEFRLIGAGEELTADDVKLAVADIFGGRSAE